LFGTLTSKNNQAEDYMANKKKIAKVAPSGMEPTPHSGGENAQLLGFDARDRVVASPSGGTRTADIISRPGPHVPQDEGWKLTPPDHFEVNKGTNFRSDSEVPKAKTWRKK
jgi:hypothetical protein